MKTTTETLVKHYPQFSPPATLTLTIKKRDGKLSSLYYVDNRPGIGNSGYLYRRVWQRRGSLAEAQRFIKYIRNSLNEFD